MVASFLEEVSQEEDQTTTAKVAVLVEIFSRTFVGTLMTEMRLKFSSRNQGLLLGMINLKLEHLLVHS